MSALPTRDPLAVTTRDGIAWTRRAMTRGGRGLYAPSDVTGCPQFVMATLDELAEHGLQDQATAEPSECERLRAQVAALLAERQNTNDALGQLEQQRAAALTGHVPHADSEHCQADGEQWPCPTVHALTSAPAEGRPPVSPPALPWAHAMSDGDLHHFLDDLVSAALNRWRSEPDVPDRETLAAIEAACAEWRTPRQGLRSDEIDADAPVPFVLTEPLAGEPAQPADTTPLVIHWDRHVLPSTGEDDHTIVPCTADDGRPVALFLSPEHRPALADELADTDDARALLAEVRRRGEITSGAAHRWLGACSTVPVPRARARALLRQLAKHGELVVREENGRRTYVANEGGGGAGA